jgi:integrase
VGCQSARKRAPQRISAGSINAAIAAVRFFFTVTLERPDLVRPLTTVNKPRRAPVVLSREEVARLLEAAPSLKYKAALSVAYGAGLRVSEVANLKVSDGSSSRPARSARSEARRPKQRRVMPPLANPADGDDGDGDGGDKLRAQDRREAQHRSADEQLSFGRNARARIDQTKASHQRRGGPPSRDDMYAAMAQLRREQSPRHFPADMSRRSS